MTPPDAAGMRQHRNTAMLLAGNVLVGATGFVFWYIVARWARVPPTEIGLGYALISVATIIALLSKGGLDNALIRLVPSAAPRDGPRMFRVATSAGLAAVLLITVVAAASSQAGIFLGQLSPTHWILVAVVAGLLALGWLQDAYLVAVADARYTLVRNLTFSGARLVLPFPLVAMAWPHPIPLVWALALFLSVGSVAHALRLPPNSGVRQPVPGIGIFRAAARNTTSGLAEFLPGLVLVPLVLTLRGAEHAAYFGIAWAAASLLFLASASISRSALADLVNGPAPSPAATLRRGLAQQALLLAPAAVVLALISKPLLAAFGPGFAQHGHVAVLLLAMSIVFVAPLNLYLAWLRARDRTRELILLPAAMILFLLVSAPVGASTYGVPGVAAAWLLATLPGGLYATLRLRRHAKEVTQHGPPLAYGGRPNLE